jgi:hypothetical protein
MTPKEVLPTIALQYSRKRKEKVKLGRLGGPAARVQKKGQSYRGHVTKVGGPCPPKAPFWKHPKRGLSPKREANPGSYGSGPARHGLLGP